MTSSKSNVFQRAWSGRLVVVLRAVAHYLFMYLAYVVGASAAGRGLPKTLLEAYSSQQFGAIVLSNRSNAWYS